MVVVLRVPVEVVEFCAMAAAVSILVVLFLVAPLGSIYVLLISLHQEQPSTTSTTQKSASSEETAALIIDWLQKNNLRFEGGGDGPGGVTAATGGSATAALDELWSAVIANPALAELLHQRTLQHHMRLVLPWLLTFLLAVSIPCLLVVCSAWSTTATRPDHRRGRSPTRWYHYCYDYYRRQTRERIHKIVTAALDCQVVVTSTARTSNDYGDEGDGGRTSKKNGTGTGNSSNNVCGICFEGFSSSHSDNQHEVEDHNNRNAQWNHDDDDKHKFNVLAVRGSTCPHTFHEHCISHWLRLRSSHYQCPLCRRDFLDAAATRKLKRLSG